MLVTWGRASRTAAQRQNTTIGSALTDVHEAAQLPARHAYPPAAGCAPGRAGRPERRRRLGGAAPRSQLATGPGGPRSGARCRRGCAPGWCGWRRWGSVPWGTCRAGGRRRSGGGSGRRRRTHFNLMVCNRDLRQRPPTCSPHRLLRSPVPPNSRLSTLKYILHTFRKPAPGRRQQVGDSANAGAGATLTALTALPDPL